MLPERCRAVIAIAAIGLATLVVGSGCATPPTAHEPRSFSFERGAIDPETGEDYLQTYARRSAEQARELPDGPLSLVQAKSIALAHNPDLRAALARIERAQATVARAQSTFAPTLDANAGWSFADRGQNLAFGSIPDIILDPEDPEAVIPGGGARATQTHTWNVGLQANYTLFDWYRRTYALYAAQRDVDVQSAARDDARKLIAQAVAQTWYTILLAEQDQVIAREDIDFNRRQQAIAQTRLEAEKGLQTDVLNFQIRVQTAEARILQAEQTAAIGRAALAELLGLPQAEIPALAAGDSAALPAPDQAHLVALAMAWRPDLQQLAYQQAQLQDRLAAARAEHKPVIAANAGAGLRRDDNLPTDPERDRELTLGVTATWRLADGGARDAAIAEIQADLDAVDAQIDSIRHRIISDIRQRLLDYDYAARQVGIQRSIVDLAQRNRELELQLFEAEKSTILRLNTVQTDLVAAQANLLRAQIARQQRYEEILAVAGLNLPGAPTPDAASGRGPTD